MKYDLKDVTFNIPIRFDTQDRIENLTLIVNYLNYHFYTNIIVLEEAKEKKFQFISSKCNYIFKKSDDPNFHRTKCLNHMAKISETKIIVNYDADVLFNAESYKKSANIIRDNESDMVFPYDGRFMECNREKYFNKIKETMDVSFINVGELHCNHPNSVGGCIFWNKDVFMNIGMENENFKSWGWEDNERIYRAKKFGVKVNRCDGVLYHMSHKRLDDSGPKNNHYNNNQKEYEKVNRMNKSELSNYIKTWEWCK